MFGLTFILENNASLKNTIENFFERKISRFIFLLC